jgi:hypothetical protein
LSVPFAFTAVNLAKFNWWLRVASGLISFVFGLALICGIGFTKGRLFTNAPAWIRIHGAALGSVSPLGSLAASIAG